MERVREFFDGVDARRGAARLDVGDRHPAETGLASEGGGVLALRGPQALQALLYAHVSQFPRGSHLRRP